MGLKFAHIVPDKLAGSSATQDATDFSSEGGTCVQKHSGFPYRRCSKFLAIMSLPRMSPSYMQPNDIAML